MSNSKSYLPSDFIERILDLSVNGIYIYDLIKGANIYINQQYTELTGYTLDDINAMSEQEFFSLFHP
jgi:two-component system, chemotaxis family, CheB/CheR fusion protein